jgi:hypothetical protein
MFLNNFIFCIFTKQLIKLYMKFFLTLFFALPFLCFSQTKHGCVTCAWFMEQHYNPYTKEFETKVNDPVKYMMNIKKGEINFIGNNGNQNYKLFYYSYDAKIKSDILHIKDNKYSKIVRGSINIPTNLPGIIELTWLENNEYSKRLYFFDCNYSPQILRNSKYCK